MQLEKTIASNSIQIPELTQDTFLDFSADFGHVLSGNNQYMKLLRFMASIEANASR